jgi:hypothetical protein
MAPRQCRERDRSEKAPSSIRKAEANRQNALKSTGPRTLKGKTYSRRNALKHGLFARDLFSGFNMQSENPEEFVSLHAQLREELQPVGRAEELEIEHIAVCWWKRARLWRNENAEMRVALGHVAQRASACPPREMLAPEYKALLLALEDAQETIKATGEIPQELKAKILATDPRFWIGVEEEARRIARITDLQYRDKLVKEEKITPAEAKVLVEEHPTFKEARAWLVPLLQTNIAISCIKAEAKRRLESAQNVFYEQQAIPNGDALDRILRFAEMIDRDLNRAFDRFERLQRRRKGERVPPSLNLNVNV